MSISRRKLYFINTLVALAIMTGVTVLFARSNGITGQTEDGCGGGSCHGGSANTATKISVSSETGSFTVDPNSTTTFTVTVENSNQNAAGLNFGVKSSSSGGSNVGTLAAGTGTKIQSGEVVHDGEQTLNGGKFDFTFDWTAPSSPGVYYIRGSANAVNDNGSNSGDTWNVFDAIELTVAGLTVSAPNGGENWCLESTNNITWTSTGVDNINIQLSTDNGSSWNTTIASNIDASTGSYNWTIPPAFETGDQMKIRIVDASNSNRTDATDGSFSISGGVSIVEQPQSQSVCTGTTATLTVVTSTVAGNQYQWLKGGNPINGATNPSYEITSVSDTDAGDYTCVVTGPCNNEVTSDVATLSVTISPGFTQQPSNKSACPGESVTFSAGVVGDDNAYQWQKDGNNISGANSNILTIDNVESGDEGEYRLVITSETCGLSVNSQTVNLTVNDNPAITQDISNAQLCAGETLTLEIQVVGSVSGYEWYKDNVKLEGQNTRTLTIENTTSDDTGIYRAEAIGTCGTNAVSEDANVIVRGLPEITVQPTPIEAIEGSDASLSVSAEFPGGIATSLTYQWFKDSSPVNGATEATLEFTGLTMDDAGMYYVEITNTCDATTTSETVEVEVIENTSGPAITVNQSSLELGESNVGSSVENTFTAVITNTGDSELTINSFDIAGTDAGAFEILSPSTPHSVEVDGTVDLQVRFTPTKVGSHVANIAFTSDAINNPNVFLSGTGTEAGGVTVSQSTVEFEDVTVGNSSDFTLTLTNNSSESKSVTAVNFSDAAFLLSTPQLPATIEGNSTLELIMTFAPQSQGEFSGTATIQIDGEDDISVSLSGSAVMTSVYGEIAEVESITTYPNPTSEEFSIAIDFADAVSYSLIITDLNGNSVKQYSGNSVSGRETIKWDGTDNSGNRVPSGRYFGLLKVNNKIKVINLMVGK